MTRWLLALLLFAIGLWLNTRSNQFPYYYHPDEYKKVEQVLTGERNFNHPLLLLTSSEAFWNLKGKTADSQQVVRLGRWISALFCAAGTVFFAMSAWSWRGPLAGVVTGVLLMLNHQVFELAHYMKEDPALYMGVGLAAWIMVLYGKMPTWRWAVALGGAVGLAFSGKYLGLILLVPAVVLVWRSAGDKKWIQIAWIAGAVLLVFGIINLQLLTGMDVFWQSFNKEIGWAVNGQKELTRSVPHSIYLSIFVTKTTPVIWLMLAVAFYQMWRSRADRQPITWVLAATFFGWLVLLSFSPKTNDRYFLPLTGLAYLLAGDGAVAAWNLWGKKRPIVAVLLAVCLSGGVIWEGSRTWRFSHALATDDRAELTVWIRKNIPESATIAYDARVNLPDEEVYRELANPLPHRLLRDTFAGDMGSIEELRKKGVGYVVVSESVYGRFFLKSLRPQKGKGGDYERRAAFYRTLKERPPLWKRDRGEVLYLHPGLEVYAIDR